eukprot:TRINITY_DN112294_c0_g1_i1.p1 TRINITY_DN112294_c0_g1~~TRINITY_DN112294_c0_g1_i1.p1  ORF type:complete len:950 (+),score=189.88 TRINITY_DN112294_c0_g1_i1:82-2850(+)
MPGDASDPPAISLSSSGDGGVQRRIASWEDTLETISGATSPAEKEKLPAWHHTQSPRRWVMLGILSLNICVSYLPYYTFVPIVRQSMQVYGVDEASLNLLCIMYALVYVPGAFLTGPIVGTFGCRWTFVLAMILNLLGCFIRCGETFLIESLSFFGGTQPVAPALHPATAAALAAEASGLHAANATWQHGHHAGGHGDLEFVTVARPMMMSFSLLVIGQAVCALGQPLLVNVTSEMGHDWFPPHERPAAAMVSNLMNFVGSSLSFMLPPVFVEEHSHDLHALEGQVQELLKMQLNLAAFCLVLTVLLYRQPATSASDAHRSSVSFPAEVLQVLGLRDFWIVTIQFSLYVAIGHAFDAVEGSLLEHYGYSAALTSWTGLACAITAVLSTMLEAKLISHANMYQTALYVANGFLAISMFVGFLSLHHQMHENVFVLAVALLGMSTPGWGCSCELAAEVSWPAREATVSSLLEAVSNLVGVVAILGTQALIDKGLGSSVFLVMAVAAILGGSLLCFMRGRLLRTEAEEESSSPEEGIELCESPRIVEKDSFLMVGVSAVSKMSNTVGSRCTLQQLRFQKSSQKLANEWRGLSTWRKCATTLLPCVIFVNLIVGRFQTPHTAGLADPMQSILPDTLAAKPLPRVQSQDVALAGLSVPRSAAIAHQPTDTTPGHRSARRFDRIPTYVIHCPRKSWQLGRFAAAMESENVSYVVFNCSSGSPDDVAAAVRAHLLPVEALKATEGVTKTGRKRAALLGAAISHLQILRTIAHGPAEFANVLETSEVVRENYLQHRTELLQSIGSGLYVVNLDAAHPTGLMLKFTQRHKMKKHKKHWMYGTIFRMRKGLSPLTNEHMSNYVVSKKGARAILKLGQRYTPDGKWESFDRFIYSELYSNTSAVGYSVQASMLSVNCAHKKISRKWAALCKHD